VPLTAFGKPEQQSDGESLPARFASGDIQQLMFFAGIRGPQWRSVRNEGGVTADLFAFETMEPNVALAPIFPGAMLLRAYD
jgi:putative SOS response-associated peptidase YedK